MTEIKSDIKETVKAFIQTLVSIIVKEATKKMIKSLNEREKKKFESRIKDMSDDQLAQYLDKNICFKNALENALKSLDCTHSAKGTVSLTDKLQSIFEETFARKSINAFNWPVLHTVPAILVGILLLSTVTVSAVLLNNTTDNTTLLNNTTLSTSTTNSTNITVLPVANFSSNVTSGSSPLTVQFSDLSENASEWNWDFGDGNNSAEQNPVHTYFAKGNYTVNLTVSDGNNTNSMNSTITVPEKPIPIGPSGPSRPSRPSEELKPDPVLPVSPVANFNANVTNGVTPFTVQFTDLSTNATSWSWNFGDGQTSSAQNPINTYYSAGIYTVSLIATNINGSNISTKSNLVIVDKTTPTVIWSNPEDITYGEELSEFGEVTQLNAEFIGIDGNPLPGNHTYTPASGTVLSVGKHTLYVDFTPADTANYTNASKNVQISVVPPTRITPVIIWSPEIDYVTYGETLSDLQLYAYAIDPITEDEVPGQFTYTPSEGTRLHEDTQIHISFTPTDSAKYNTASEDVIIHFQKATPDIDWSNPADIVYGTALNDTQLNATASYNGSIVPGNFVYSPKNGTKLSAGIQTLHTEFIPEDTENYTSASKDVTINVLNAYYAYITNYWKDTVTVVDPTGKVIATIPVGSHPIGVAINQEGTRVYVTNDGKKNVSTIDIETNVVIATVPVGLTPKGVAVNPDGTKIYVTNLNDNTVSVIDTASNNVIATVPVGNEPFGVVVIPDGTKVYVCNSNSSTVSVIDAASNNVIATVPVETNPLGVSVTPDGAKVYITNYDSNTVSVIDTATNTVTTTVPVGSNPWGVAANPVGTSVYVTNDNEDTVSIIDTATNTVTTVPVGRGPMGVSVTPDGTKVYVINSESNDVSVIDTATNTVTATVPVVDAGPWTIGQFIGPIL